MTDRQTGWGDPYITVDVASALASFEQVPNCGYTLEVTPKLLNIDGSLSDLPVPMSLSYESNTGSLYAEKCSPDTFAFDNECLSDPYEIIYDVVFFVSANGDMANANSDLEVRIEIGNTCLTDQVTIQNLLLNQQSQVQDGENFSYVLSNPSTALIVDPVLL